MAYIAESCRICFVDTSKEFHEACTTQGTSTKLFSIEREKHVIMVGMSAVRVAGVRSGTPGALRSKGLAFSTFERFSGFLGRCA